MQRATYVYSRHIPRSLMRVEHYSLVLCKTLGSLCFPCSRAASLSTFDLEPCPLAGPSMLALPAIAPADFVLSSGPSTQWTCAQNRRPRSRCGCVQNACALGAAPTLRTSRGLHAKSNLVAPLPLLHCAVTIIYEYIAWMKRSDLLVLRGVCLN